MTIINYYLSLKVIEIAKILPKNPPAPVIIIILFLNQTSFILN